MRYVILLMFVCGIARAQQKVDYNTIILPKGAKDVEFREKLVQIAYNNSPTTSILNHEVTASEYRVKQAKFRWLENLRVTGNLNEFNLNKSTASPDGTQNLGNFYPRYNIGVIISVGELLTNPMRTKVENENLAINEENINIQKLNVRTEVLKRYEEYLSAKEIYDIRVDALEDATQVRDLKQSRFSRNEIAVSEYNEAVDRYNETKISLAQSKRDMNLSLIELEGLLGVKLADIPQN